MDTDTEAAGFARIVPRDATLDRIACQLQFGEGPVWNARQGHLRWVDIVGDTIWQWTPGEGTSIFLRPSGKANGMTYDKQGRLVVAGWSSRTVWRVDRSWYIKRMTYDTAAPMGIALSRDDKTLYVAESGLGENKRELRAYPIHDDGSLGTYDVLQTFGADRRGPHRGIAGMCVDREGDIIACAGWEKNGPGAMIYVMTPTGRVIETHPMPERPTKCAFGDASLRTLYVTTEGGHLYRVRECGRRGGLVPSPLAREG